MGVWFRSRCPPPYTWSQLPLSMREMGRHKTRMGQKTRGKRKQRTKKKPGLSSVAGGDAPAKKQVCPSSRQAVALDSGAPAAAILNDSSGDEEDGPTDYELFISSLEPLRKKLRLEERKLEKSSTEEDILKPSGDCLGVDVTVLETEKDKEKEDERDGGRMVDADSEGSDLEQTDEESKDPFCEHVEQDLDDEEIEQLKETFSRPLNYIRNEYPMLGLVSTAICLPMRDTPIAIYDKLSMKKLHVKQRLLKLWSPLKTAEDGEKHSAAPASSTRTFSPLQRNLFAVLNSYKDALFTRRTFSNGEVIRQTYLLHALNHVLKTRSRVLRNNAKLSRAAKEGSSEMELRDQGLTRPKVLILLPFREAALRTVNMIISLLLPPGEGQVSHRKRFMEEFREEEHLPSKAPKPESYEEMFAGNIDDCFRVGVAVKRNTVRLYSNFYSSDIIIASPLGLRPIIGAEGEKERDYDFLSSLEMVIVDQADVYLMQNWDHLLHLFSHLHLQPRESHGTDFSRVRMWSLNGWTKYYRQTIILSSFPTPEINSLFNTHCQNYAGKVRVSEPRCPGTVSQVALHVPQTFHRISCESHLQLHEARWKYFIDKVLPECSGELMKQTMIFVPSYFDFVRLRNHLSREEMNFVPLSEHTSSSDVSRARSHFFHGHTHFLLYTERIHFFKRYHIRGVRHLVFYALPTYSEFYPELVNMLEGAGQVGGATCTVLYSTYDALCLSRIVGSGRANRMIKSTEPIQTLIFGMQ